MGAISQTTFFQVYFREWNFWILQKITEMCFLGCVWQYDSNGSDNGLAPERWQPIIWTNVGVPHWRISTRHQSNICAVFVIGALSILQINSMTASRPSILCNYTVQASGWVLVPCELLGVTQKQLWVEIKYQRVEIIISIDNTFYFKICITITDDEYSTCMYSWQFWKKCFKLSQWSMYTPVQK